MSESMPSVKALESAYRGPPAPFVHRLPAGVPTKPGSKARCGEVPAGGFRLVSDEEFLKHPCPDCLRREREEKR